MKAACPSTTTGVSSKHRSRTRHRVLYAVIVKRIQFKRREQGSITAWICQDLPADAAVLPVPALADPFNETGGNRSTNDLMEL